jgi:hypothetical protein
MCTHTTIEWLDSLKLASEVEQYQGFTYRYGLPTPTTGYMVSLEGYELMVSLDEIDLTKVIDDYLESHQFILDVDNFYIGAWVDAGHLFLDISECFQEEENARCISKQRNQLAYFDLNNMETILM